MVVGNCGWLDMWGKRTVSEEARSRIGGTIAGSERETERGGGRRKDGYHIFAYFVGCGLWAVGLCSIREVYIYAETYRHFLRYRVVYPVVVIGRTCRNSIGWRLFEGERGIRF